MSKPSRLQFGLASLFGLVTVVAVVLAAMFTFPTWLAVPILVLLNLVLLGTLVTVAIYRPGYARTFCIGATIAAGASAYFAFEMITYGVFMVEFTPDYLERQRVALNVLLSAGPIGGIVTGLVSVGVRWAVEEEGS